MLTAEQYNELLYEQECSLYTIEHLDVYQVLHWTPDQFFARKTGNVILHNPSKISFAEEKEEITFIVLLARGTDLQMLHECDLERGERIVVSFRKAIEDRIGYAFVSLQKRKIPLEVRPRS